MAFRSWRVRLLTTVLGYALLLLAPWPAASHPHMTVEYTLELLVGPRGPEGLRFTWTIDRDVSELLLDLSDADRNGALSPVEVRRLETHVRQEQGRSGFFTAITLDGESVTTPAPRSFGATVDQGRLKYQFTLPIGATARRAAPSTSSSTIQPTSWRSRSRLGRRLPSPRVAVRRRVPGQP